MKPACSPTASASAWGRLSRDRRSGAGRRAARGAGAARVRVARAKTWGEGRKGKKGTVTLESTASGRGPGGNGPGPTTWSRRLGGDDQGRQPTVDLAPAALCPRHFLKQGPRRFHGIRRVQHC